jgi:hypothetical protein
VFLYFEISFLQLIVVCFVIMSCAFFLAILPMVPSVFIQSLVSIESFGGLGIVVCPVSVLGGEFDGFFDDVVC